MTTSKGVLMAESCVKPTISEKKMVTDSYTSGIIFSLAFSFSAMELKEILRFVYQRMFPHKNWYKRKRQREKKANLRIHMHTHSFMHKHTHTRIHACIHTQYLQKLPLSHLHNVWIKVNSIFQDRENVLTTK